MGWDYSADPWKLTLSKNIYCLGHKKRPERFCPSEQFVGSTPLGVGHRAEYQMFLESYLIFLLSSPVTDRTILLSANIAKKTEPTIVFLKKLLAS